MASVYLTEHYAPKFVGGNLLPAVSMPPIAEQKITIGGASVASSAFNALTQVLGVHAEAVCSVAFGAAPTATSANRRLAAHSTEYFEVTPGQKVAIITNS